MLIFKSVDAILLFEARIKGMFPCQFFFSEFCFVGHCFVGHWSQHNQHVASLHFVPTIKFFFVNMVNGL